MMKTKDKYDELYVGYLPKNAGESVLDRKLLQTLEKFTAIVATNDNDYSIIVAPGYLSTKTNTIDTFITELNKLVRHNEKDIHLGILKGMNENISKDDKSKGSGSIIEQHNKGMMDLGYFKPIKMDWNKSSDHRKMVFIFSAKGINFDGITLNSDHVNSPEFVNHIDVYGVLIGSTNVSNTSYFEPIASKGEADIFMFTSTSLGIDVGLEEYLNGEVSGENKRNGLSNRRTMVNNFLKVFDNSYISKSIYGVNYGFVVGDGKAEQCELKSGSAYLKELFINLLSSRLN